MADETSISPAAETALADTSAPPKEKKTRAPRRPKAEVITGASVSVAAKKTRGPGKRKASVAASAALAAKAPAESNQVAAESQPAKRGPRKVEAASAPVDGFAELLKLEEENQKLRRALSEKLRAENAELRKKLGTA
ncbi:hypothetical protein B5K11_27840 [Rhizobium leguminosarum bv. trifolii]|uniref:hypothetical protein n=1 Tax=Rhizobium leguminosarum TaxID=384 RepID=UPI000E2EAE54|nr:hypothetical protein [Rhizobium leguminosarum]RFB86891.1 hypothetical protein B5K11_27840 [Rhizobium leguminosarum bv. trifolii]